MTTRLAAAFAVLSLLFVPTFAGAEPATKPPAKKAVKATAKKPSKALSSAGRKALQRYQSAAQEVSSTAAQGNAGPDTRPVKPVRSKPLRDIRPIPPPHPGDDIGRDRIPEPPRPPKPFESTEPDTTPRQTMLGEPLSAPAATGLSFDGIGVGLNGFSPSSNPPDVNGRVGATQYVQWNNSSFAIFDKTTGALLYGPAAGNTLFQSLGGTCATHNDGDPVVSYDLMAGRWVLSQFAVGASPNYSHQCVAVSVTGDATGSYYLYDFVTDAVNFVDYPHTGVWPDGYYMTTHVFNAAGTAQVAARVHVFERDKMLLGQSARQLTADLKKYSNRFQYGFLPSDLDSTTQPPAGEAAFVIGPDPAFTNRLDSTRVKVTWGVTPTITLTESTISTTWEVAPCASGATPEKRDCVPQPSPALATDYLDNIGQHLMYRLPYRNFGGNPVQESLVANITGGGSTNGAHARIRWYEFRNAGNSTATPTVYQAATFDPDTHWRWLGSIAMDKDHDIALGYSKSSTSVKPSIWINGRLGTDTINTLGTEIEMQAGGGVQLANAGNRWGDYSAMTLDPVDQCTFWYTNEYLKADGIFNWSTRIATFKFPSCTSASAWGTVSGTITSCSSGVPLAGVVVTLSNGYAAASDASGNYSISVPAGSYTATAADADRNCSGATPVSGSVTVSSGNTTMQNFCMTGTSNLQFNTVAVDDATTGNGNGVINRDECVKVNVTLKNNGCANETGISATLSTSTTGVTVTQNSSTYSNLAIDASGVNATAFKIQTSSSFVCGTTINFTLHVTYAGGSKDIGFTMPSCAGANQTIASSSIALSDPSQNDRLGRDGLASTCDGKTCPGGIGSGTRNYKKFTFTNPASVAACMTVQINAACGNGGSAGDIESAAYLTSYDATSLCTNYLGDSGVSGLGTSVSSASYSFSVPANSNFVVVVNTNAVSTTCAQFDGLVSGFFDVTPGPGACANCTPPPTPTITPGGATTFCNGNSVTLTSSSSNAYQWYRDNNIINGATSQQYVATISGSYTVQVTDANNCSSTSAGTTVTVTPVTVNPSTLPTGGVGGSYGTTTFTESGGSGTATFSETGTLPTGMTFSNANGTLSGTPTQSGSFPITASVTDSGGCTGSRDYTLVIVPVPANVTATASSSTSVSVNWTASAGATSYEVQRDNVTIGTPSTNSFSDTTASPATTYFYRVRAITGTSPTSYSSTDMATTVALTDDPLVSTVTTIKAVHITQLRSAVNSVRAKAGLSAATFTDSNLSGLTVQRIHVKELRDALDPARVILGLSPISYTNSLAVGTTVAAVDVQEIRNGVK